MLHWVRGAALCAVLMGAWLGAAWSASAQEPAEGDAKLVGVVNVNTATPEQLDLLPGVGPKIAGAIIAYRDQNGGFEIPSELTAVRGIGERALARMRPFVAVDGETTAQPVP